MGRWQQAAGVCISCGATHTPCPANPGWFSARYAQPVMVHVHNTHQRHVSLCTDQTNGGTLLLLLLHVFATAAARIRSTRTCTAAPMPSVRHPRSLHTAAKRRHTAAMSGKRYSYSGSARRGTGWWGVDRNTRPLMLCRVAAYCCRWLAGSLESLAQSCSRRHTSCTWAMDAAAAGSDAQMGWPAVAGREGGVATWCGVVNTAPLHVRPDKASRHTTPHHTP